MASSLNFIDVFSGAGGFSKGLELSGHKCLLGIEIDPYASKTFKLNHPKAHAYNGDISNLTDFELKKIIGKRPVHLVVGGPPCQGFSTVGLGNPNDIRNKLFLEFVRMVKTTKAPYFVIENVTGILAQKNENTMKAIFKIFNQLGYKLGIKVLEAQHYGVAENRRRTIIIGSKINSDIIFPEIICDDSSKNKKLKTINEFIFNIKAKDGQIYNHDLKTAEIKSPIDLQRIKRIPEGCGIRYECDELRYLPKKLKLNIDWRSLPEGRFRQAKYQRLHRLKPSPTIMTHRHNYFHPTENRYLTAREAASIQSFPNDFIFVGSLSHQWRQIGNAVPPLLAFAIGNSLKKMYLNSKKEKNNKKIHSISHSIFKEIRKNAFYYKKSA